MLDSGISPTSITPFFLGSSRFNPIVRDVFIQRSQAPEDKIAGYIDDAFDVLRKLQSVDVHQQVMEALESPPLDRDLDAQALFLLSALDRQDMQDPEAFNTFLDSIAEDYMEEEESDMDSVSDDEIEVEVREANSPSSDSDSDDERTFEGVDFAAPPGFKVLDEADESDETAPDVHVAAVAVPDGFKPPISDKAAAVPFPLSKYWGPLSMDNMFPPRTASAANASASDSDGQEDVDFEFDLDVLQKHKEIANKERGDEPVENPSPLSSLEAFRRRMRDAQNATSRLRMRDLLMPFPPADEDNPDELREAFFARADHKRRPARTKAMLKLLSTEQRLTEEERGMLSSLIYAMHDGDVDEMWDLVTRIHPRRGTFTLDHCLRLISEAGEQEEYPTAIALAHYTTLVLHLNLSRGQVGTLENQVDPDTACTVAAVAASARSPALAMLALRLTPWADLDVVTRACDGDEEELERILGRHVETLNYAISAHEGQSNSDIGYDLFGMLKSVTPSFRMSSNASDESAVEHLSERDLYPLAPNTGTFTALARLCSSTIGDNPRKEQLRAVNLLKQIRDMHFKPSTSIYNHILLKFCTGTTSDLEHAMALLGEMQEDDVQPDALTFRVLFHNAMMTGQTQHMSQVLQKCEEFGVNVEDVMPPHMRDDDDEEE